MTIVPITLNVVNWSAFMRAAKQEQGKDVTAHLDRTGTPLHLPSSFVNAVSGLGETGQGPGFSDGILHHLHFGFYYSLDNQTLLDLSTNSELNITNFDGKGIVSGTFSQWKVAIANLINVDVALAIGFYRTFERAGLDRYFHKDVKDDIRKKSQAACR